MLNKPAILWQLRPEDPWDWFTLCVFLCDLLRSRSRCVQHHGGQFVWSVRCHCYCRLSLQPSFGNRPPNPIQIAGIALALVSLLMIAVKPKPDKATALENEPTAKDWKPLVLLFVFFLLYEFSRIAQETFKYESVADQKPTFLLAAFTIAGISC